jgi:hypothetical protein
MRAMTTGAVGAALFLSGSGCLRTAPGATPGQLYQRAEIDLACPAPHLRHYDIDERARLVQGCGKQVVYVESCDPIRGAYRCTWLADSPSFVAGPISLVLFGVPNPPSADAPVATPAVASAAPPLCTPSAPRASAQRGNGLLHVASVGGYCSVAVDGKSFGATPVGGIVVPEGVANVSCKTPDKTVQHQVRIEPGATARVRFDLDRPAGSPTDWGF